MILPETTFVFGNEDISRLVYNTTATRSIAASRKFNAADVIGMDGQLAYPSGLEPVELTVKGYLRAIEPADVADARKQLAAMLMSSEPQPLYLNDDKETYLMAYYKGGAELSRLDYCPEVELEFFCPDPVCFGIDRTAILTTSASTINSGGSYKAKPIITAKPTSSVSSWTLYNITSGARVTVKTSLSSTSTVVIDMAKERCTVNGTDCAVTIDSDFFSLSGSQQLYVSNGTATMSWTERWL